MTAIATIYEHSNHGGRGLQLQGAGDYDYSTLASFGFNDLTSSIKIESGYYLQAFTDAGFKGASAIFTGSTSYVGDGFNDKISSLRLVRGTPSSSLSADYPINGAAASQSSATTALATIYEHANYGGRALRLNGAGNYDYNTLVSRSFNDLTSSIKIESGYYLETYNEPGFKGASAIFTGSTSYVGDGFNDKISSLRLTRGTLSIFSPTPSSSSSIPGSSSSSDPFWLNLASRLDQQAAATSKKVKQGVWNKSGFLLHVAWIDPITGQTVKEDTTALGQSSTIVHSSNRQPYQVRLSVFGKSIAEAGIVAASVAVVGPAALVWGGVKAAPAVLAGIAPSAKILGVGSRNADRGSWLDTFWTGTPSGDGRYVDVWGTVWNPQYGTGGFL